MPEETVTVESSPTEEVTPQASEQPKPMKDLKDFTQEEYEAFFKEGKYPEDKPQEQESAPAAEEASESVEDKKAPAPEADKKPKVPKKETAEERKAKLSAEIQELVRQKNALKADLEKPAETPKKEEVKTAPSTEAKSTDDRPVPPKASDYYGQEDGWDKYEQAKSDYFEKLAEWKSEQKLKAYREEVAKERQQEQEERAKSERLQKWESSINDARKEFEDFDAVVNDYRPSPMILELLEESDQRAKVLYKLAEDAELSATIAKMNRVQATRAIIAIEDEVSTTKQSEPETRKASPPVSKTPKPATVLRGGAKPGDPSDAAIANDDFVAYEALENAKQAARQRR